MSSLAEQVNDAKVAPNMARSQHSVDKDRAVALARQIVRADGLTITGHDSVLLASQLLRALGLTA